MSVAPEHRKFTVDAEVRVVGREPRIGLARALVGLATLVAAASAATHGSAATPGVRVDVLNGPAPIAMTTVPASFVVPRGAVTRSRPVPVRVAAATDLESLAAAALAGDAQRDARPIRYAQPPRVPAVNGRAVMPVAPDGPIGTLAGEEPPRSSEGVTYVPNSLLHEHGLPDSRVELIEGGFTHRDFGGSDGTGRTVQGRPIDPSIPDPSDAFMNIAVQTYMQNTTSTWAAAADAVERMHKIARGCVETFGQFHQCSFGTAGIAFDYGNKRFTARLTPALADGVDVNRGGNTLVAVETPDSLIEGPAFHHVASAEAEPVPMTVR